MEEAGGRECKGSRVEDAADQTRWREGVRTITEGMRCIQPPSMMKKITD